MFIQIQELRKVYNDILKEKNAHNIVKEINKLGFNLSSRSFTNFMQGKEVTAKTLTTLDRYAVKWLYADMVNVNQY